MLYYEDEAIRIRDFEETDIPMIAEEELAQGWSSTVEKHEDRLKDRREGKCISLAAEYQGKPAGYISIYPNSIWGPFGNRGYAELIDFAVLEKYRRLGIGEKLMDAAEEIAAKYADTVYLAVGLHSGYGSAQRMYVKRGYVPDGSGVWYGSKALPPYENCCNDDDLNLYFSKKLAASD